MMRKLLRFTAVRHKDHLRAIGPTGRAYEIEKRYPGEWILVAYANEDKEYGEKIDYGDLNAMKARARLEEQIALSEDAGA